LYGTCTSFVPVTDWKYSPVRWFDVPTPDEAMMTRPGRAFTIAMNSFTLRAGRDGMVTSTSATEETSEV
jgi:hypothetical protein